MPDDRYEERPQAIIIATDHHLLLERKALTALGFHVSTIRTLLEGYTYAYHLLASTTARQHVVILVDLASADPSFPALSSLVLIAALARHMRLGEIRQAWLLGLTTVLTSEEEAAARAAGCHHILRLPLTDATLGVLRELADGTALIPHHTVPPVSASHAVIALQDIAQQVIATVQSVQARTWTVEDVALLLRWLTPYPAPSGRRSYAFERAEEVRAETLVRALGGPQAARKRLERIAAQWEHRYPLHSAILRNFLAGWERREIVRSFVTHNLYEDSRIYACINDLPERIAAELRSC